MKIFFASLLFVTFCYHSCFGKEGPAGPHMEGDCVNGRGAVAFYDGSRYAGQFEKGSPHGQGSVAFSDGSTYTGEFRNGEMNGQGIMHFSDGTEYVGEFKDGVLCGHGTITFPDGSVYEGRFKDDKYHGEGVWSSPFGIKYEGQFKDGKFDGHGIYSLPDGSRYIGYFRDDNFHGQGEWAGENTVPEKSESAQPAQRKTADREIEADLPEGPATPSAEIDKPEEAAETRGKDRIFSNRTSPTEEPVGHKEPPIFHEGITTGEGAPKKGTVDSQVKKINKMELAKAIEEKKNDEGPQDENGIAHGSYASSELAYSVQVGAFLSRENAEKLKSLLREKGYDARLLPLDGFNNRPWYTVRLGSYISLEEAQEKAVAFSEKEKMATTIRPVDSL